jgi:acyl-CoA thioester hydrolase
MARNRTPPARRSQFRYVLTIPTRWMDNDVYGHVNNVVYYSYFDTIINRYLIDAGGLDIDRGKIIGIAVETSCRFHRSFSYPEDVEAGLRVAQLGSSSVRYEVALFGPGEETARADGQFVHVFVDRSGRRPVTMPAQMRRALEKLHVD